MAIVVPAPRISGHLTRTCTTCSRSRPSTVFPVTRDAAGKIAAGSVCWDCAAGTVPVQHTCVACGMDRPDHRYQVMPATGHRRRVCDLCLDRVDVMLRDGFRIVEVSAATGVGRSTVGARKSELSLAVLRSRVEGRVAAEILHVAQEPFSSDAELVAAVVERVGVSVSLARRFLVSQGLIEKGDKPDLVSADVSARMAAFIADEVPFAEIARTLGVSEETVARHHPGRGRTPEHRALIAWVAHQPEMVQKLHRE